MLKEGTLVIWQDAQGYGFIETADRARYFLHIKSVKRTGSGRPQVGDRVAFQSGVDQRGRQIAVAATIGVGVSGGVHRSAQRHPRRVHSSWGWIDVLGAVGLLLLGGIIPRLSHALLLLQIMGGLSALSVVLYAADKSQARRGGRRVAENTLQMLALAGGWPGAWLAQHLFRHKTVKTEFRVVFGATIILQVGLVIASYFLANQASLSGVFR